VDPGLQAAIQAGEGPGALNLSAPIDENSRSTKSGCFFGRSSAKAKREQMSKQKLDRDQTNAKRDPFAKLAG
jgi:hypothetical protein